MTSERIRDKLANIVGQADRMTHIIEHIRMFSREAGKPERSPVKVNDVMRSAMDILSAQFQGKGLELTDELSDHLPDVLVNPFSLEEVILNLLTNARDAVEERLKKTSDTHLNRITLRTLLDRKNGDPYVIIEVIDFGFGIPKDMLSRLFDPFFTTKEPDKGTGLGLSISKSIIEQFEGTIQIQSAAGKGTTVTIRLPALDTKE